MIMVRRVRRLLADLSGRSGQRALDLIIAQIDVAVRSARLAEAVTAGTSSTADARSAMNAIEHEGDDYRAELVLVLGHVLATRIDREDLYRVSRSVDDVVDNLRDFVREGDLYQPVSLAGDAPLLTAVAEGLADLRRAVRALAEEPGRVDLHLVAARKSAGAVRTSYQRRLVDLFAADDVAMELIKRRELLRRLDVVGLRLIEAVDALSDGLLKRHF